MTASALFDFATACWLGFVGSCIGSFLNVVAYRWPLGMSVVWKPSHCPRCGHAIRAYDNIPVLGWLWLRGRCRDCGEPISPRYAVVEFLTGACFFALAYAELFTGGGVGQPFSLYQIAAEGTEFVWREFGTLFVLYAYHAAGLSVLLAAVLIDRDEHALPRALLAAGFAIAVVGRFLLRDTPLGTFSGSNLVWLAACVGLWKVWSLMADPAPKHNRAWAAALVVCFLGAAAGAQVLAAAVVGELVRRYVATGRLGVLWIATVLRVMLFGM